MTKGINHGDHAEVTFEPVKVKLLFFPHKNWNFFFFTYCFVFVHKKGGAPITLKCDNLLVATGRGPFSDGLGAKEIGIKFDNNQRININEHY